MASYPEPQVRSTRVRSLMVTVFMLALLVAVAGMAVAWQYQAWLAPVEPGSTGTYRVVIPPGAGAAEIGRLLYQAGLVKSRYGWDFYIRSQGLDQQLRAGTYQLGPGMSIPEIAEELINGQVKEVQITVPEGYTLSQTADLFEARGIVGAQDFLAAAAIGNFQFPWLDELPDGPNRLEGFLFPDTYRFRAQASAEEIIQKMLDRFTRIFTPAYVERAASIQMQVVDVVTLASIIEKEAQLPAERPIISGVFHNRLRQGWRLESCATVQYILDEPKPVLSYQDLQIPSPYNTYLHEGLPPGPIASPGRASLEAALYPADVPYFYFVANGDGSHTFSRTLEEHNQAKMAARSGE